VPLPPPTLALILHGPIERADLDGLYERVCGLLEKSAATTIVCDLKGAKPDAVTVDALARLHLAARRHGCQVKLRGISTELRELLELFGLADVLVEREAGE
jgi:ABC-type transporter Mla MlaB component